MNEWERVGYLNGDATTHEDAVPPYKPQRREDRLEPKPGEPILDMKRLQKHPRGDRRMLERMKKPYS